MHIIDERKTYNNTKGSVSISNSLLEWKQETFDTDDCDFLFYQYDALIFLLTSHQHSLLAQKFRIVSFCYGIHLLFPYLHTKRDNELLLNYHTAEMKKI